MPLVGVDVATAVSATQWSCLAAAGVQWMATRAWHSGGTADKTAIANLQGAHTAGIQSADVYFFPCPTKDAGEQASSMLAMLNGAAAHFGKIWIDVEPNPSPGCAWSKDTGCVFLREAVATLQQAGVGVGFYSSKEDWEKTVGTECSIQGEYNLDLWYPHYDGQASCDDFVPFAGWTSAHAKQFSDKSGSPAIAKCGASVDTSTVCATASNHTAVERVGSAP